MGATDCVLSDAGIKDKLMGMEKWGYDYTFDCTGNVNVMRCALEVAHRGWGESCVIGVAAAGKEIATRFDQKTFLEIVKSLFIILATTARFARLRGSLRFRGFLHPF